jgi:hypothetical protein
VCGIIGDRKGKFKLLPSAAFLLITWIWLAAPTHAQMTVSYRGELELDTTVYTGDGIELKKGKFEIEIRSEKGHQFLVFLRGGNVIALVNGGSADNEGKEKKRPDVPLTGTIYLYPPEIPREPQKEEASTVTFAEHLRSRPWKAALRVYGDPSHLNNEVDCVLEEETKPGQWSRTQFNLFLKKPA